MTKSDGIGTPRQPDRPRRRDPPGPVCGEGRPARSFFWGITFSEMACQFLQLISYN